MAKRKYPMQAFMVREYDANGTDSWLSAQESPDYFAEVGETVEVAEYQFVRMVKVSAQVKVT